MNHRIPIWLTLVTLACACSNGGTYPDEYAAEFCHSLFTCIGADNVEAVTTWDDEAECREESAEVVRQDPSYDGWEEGDCEFNADAAQACIDEVAQIRSDSDCDGGMGYIAFGFDIWDNDCARVYHCD